MQADPRLTAPDCFETTTQPSTLIPYRSLGIAVYNSAIIIDEDCR